MMVLDMKPERKRPRGRPRLRWEELIRKDGTLKVGTIWRKLGRRIWESFSY
jgi:hypothetical protein